MVENSARDGTRFKTLLDKQGFITTICTSGIEAESVLNESISTFSAVVILWEIPGPPSCFDLLIKCKKEEPTLPLIVISSTLDVSLAARAYALGANDFLEKPIDAERLISCLQNLLIERNNWSPIIEQLQDRIAGQSPELGKVISQLAQIIPNDHLRVVLIGESGTGKELLAKSIHDFSSRAKAPWVAVNMGEIPATLIETALFGHERGAFTDATEQRSGYFEEVGKGTLFLDEIGELDISLQVKLLRTIQEKEFRRVGGNKVIPFNARLVCATNRNLAIEVNSERFRRDLYHRIAEVVVEIPPLRERQGDVDFMLKYFLDKYQGRSSPKFARETLTILRSYSFPGNVRELENIVKMAINGSNGETILPQHLPLTTMSTFLNMTGSNSESSELTSPMGSITADQNHIRLFEELLTELPEDWRNLPYKEASNIIEKAFDRVYLPYILKLCRFNITKASSVSGIDTKTFRNRWKKCGLTPLTIERPDSRDK